MHHAIYHAAVKVCMHVPGLIAKKAMGVVAGVRVLHIP